LFVDAHVLLPGAAILIANRTVPDNLGAFAHIPEPQARPPLQPVNLKFQIVEILQRHVPPAINMGPRPACPVANGARMSLAHQTYAPCICVGTSARHDKIYVERAKGTYLPFARASLRTVIC
jgi:hypothetical protein